MVGKNIFEALPFLCTDVYLLLLLEILDMIITASIPVDRMAGQLEGNVGKLTRKEQIAA
jgi:hypothetical protein